MNGCFGSLIVQVVTRQFLLVRALGWNDFLIQCVGTGECLSRMVVEWPTSSGLEWSACLARLFPLVLKV
jgi:hypothetical protein